MKKKKGGCLKVILVVIVIIVALVIIASVAGGGEKTPQRVDNTSQEQNNEQSETEELDNESQEQTKFGIGETAEMNDVQVTLVDYEESNGSEYNTPADGNVFVLVNFEIANNSDSEINVSSMMSFEAYADDYSLNYSLNAMMEKSDATQLDGTIAPGKKMNGYIGYEVPADWTAMEIHFTDDVWSNNKFVFEITK